jgi:hypothetical protein
MFPKSALAVAVLTVLVALGLGGHLSTEAHAALGTVVTIAEMPSLEGGKVALLRDADINVLVFFRTHQDRSVALLKELALCQPSFAGKSVAWVGVVPGTSSVLEVSTLVRDQQFKAPVLVDQDEALYGALGLVMHPVVAMIGRDKKMLAFEPYRSVDFCAVVSARLRNAMHEMSDTEMSNTMDPPKVIQGGDEQVARRYRAMAESMFKNKNYDKALDYVSKSLEKYPGLAQAHALRGQILSAQGKCALALPAFAQALKLDGANLSAREGVETCQKAP